MTGPPVRNPAAGWWETAALAATCAVLAFLAGPADARLAGVLLGAAALLSAVQALQVRQGARAHALAVPTVAALVVAAATAVAISLLTTA